MKLNEIKTPVAKLSVVDKLRAVEEGAQPDEASKKLLQKMADAAEKILFKRVISNPDNYGIDTYDTSKSEIRSGTHVWAQRVVLCKNGFDVELNADTDDIGGDSSNYENVYFSLDGKPTDAGCGERVAVFSAQDDWAREE